jgi:hypothetical protein
MKRQYVPITLDAFLNESKTITLKRKYGEREPVVVGSNAPLRNQVLAYVAESARVSKTDLKKFIAGLNEGSRNPIASANMWLMRNSKFFLTESKNGVTYYKLSPIGKRLSSGLTTSRLSEAEEVNIRRKLNEMGKADEEDEGSYDFVDRAKGKPRPGINDAMEEGEECEDHEEKEEIDEASKARIKRIIENIKAKRTKKLNEEEGEEEEKEKGEGEEDELTFDDLDLGDEEEKGEGEEEKEEGEEEELEGEEDKEEGEEKIEDAEGEEKVEITEFVITVENVEEAISELEELGITAEQVLDEEGEAIEDQVKVSAEDWDALKGWLEEKGVDIEEMFGGEIEVEDEMGDDLEGGEDEEGLEDLEGGDEDLDGDEDLEGGEDMDSEDFDMDLGDLGGGEDLDLGGEDEVEESLTGMEDEEDDQVPNLVAGRQKQTPNLGNGQKEVTITIK